MFGYPLTIKPTSPFKRKELTDHLESKGIETCPSITGNVDERLAINCLGTERLVTYQILT